MTDKEKKKCKYMISILGEQILDDESDRIEVLTEGNFLMKKDHCYIGYKEYDEDAPQSFYPCVHSLCLKKADGINACIRRLQATL